MPNPIFQRIYRTQVDHALAKSEAIRGLDHKLVLGRLREIFLDDLLKPLAPPSFVMRSGVVMDHTGNQTGEIDIIVANCATVPLLSLSGRDGIFPAEAVVYAIEVKSVLEKSHIDETISKFERLHSLEWLSTGEIAPELRKYIDSRLEKPHTSYESPEYSYGPLSQRSRTVLFAYRARTKIAESLSYLDEQNRKKLAPAIQVICVPGEGYWRWVRSKGWIFHGPDAERTEVLSFMSGIANTMFSVQFASIGARFGNYLS